MRSTHSAYIPTIIGLAVALTSVGAIAREPFTERIDGTTVEFAMAPLPESSPPMWIGKTEVSWDAFDIFVFQLDKPEESDADGIARPSKPYLPPDRGYGHQGYPAIGMTYESAKAYCAWLSHKTGRHYRLPTESEWEAACGDVPDDGLEAHAWFRANSKRKTHPAGSRIANEFGLHDMLGNVAEWCTDAEGNPVAKGGSFVDEPTGLTPERRIHQTEAWNESDPQIPKSRWWLADCDFVGFRVVCVAKPPEVEDTQEPRHDGDGELEAEP